MYAAFDIATGKVLGSVTHQHRAAEFLAFLEKIDRSVPKQKKLHLILDNSSTHKTRHPRFNLHFTPAN